MEGNKMKLFMLDLSFIGWAILVFLLLVSDFFSCNRMLLFPVQLSMKI